MFKTKQCVQIVCVEWIYIIIMTLWEIIYRRHYPSHLVLKSVYIMHLNAATNIKMGSEIYSKDVTVTQLRSTAQL